MEQWSEGHLELFEALSEVCDRVGKENARDIAQAIKRPNNGNTFTRRLRELQKKAEIVDVLAVDNDLDNGIQLALDKPEVFAKQVQELRWKAQILDTLYDDDNRADISHTFSESRIKDLAVRLHNVREKARLLDNKDDKDIRRQFAELSDAHKVLIAKARDTQRNRAQWIEHVKKLSKKLEKHEATLSEHGLFDGVSFKALNRPRAPSEGVPSLRSLDLLTSTDDLALDGDTMIGTPGLKTSKLTSPSPAPEELDQNNEPFLKPTKPHKDYQNNRPQTTELGHIQTSTIAADEPHQLPRHPPTPDTPAARNASPGVLLSSSPEQHTSSTQGDPDDLHSDLPARLDHHDTPTHPADYQGDISSDSPVVVSTRVVRKRKARASPQRPRIKAEIDSSSPVDFLGIASLRPQESLDLDEIGQKTATPKKKQRLHIQPYVFPSENEAAEAEKYHYKHPPIFESDEVESSTPKRRRLAQTDIPRGRRQITALQPKSPNKMILPRTSLKYTPAKRSSRRDGATGDLILAEDGENEPQLDTAAQNHKSPKKVEASRRLAQLLETASPKSAILETPINRLSKGRTARVAGHTPRDGYNSTAKRGERRRVEPSTDTDNAENEPLRARPLWRLGLEHFKVNPDHNQGYDYAFRDVVRGREQRKCLDGCTKPECCGNAFRKLAELTRVEGRKQTPDEKKEDERLLKDYLGGNVHKLQVMSQDERHETLIKAKARELANKHGKHRHAFERRQSPPGFWRADFPTTQEAQSDRAEAAEFERELVRKRYEEAMRDGGKWMFRDE